MADISCANPRCQEPWDAYGVNQAYYHDQGDMIREEAMLFRQGKGCPSCHFGYGPSLPIGQAIQQAKARPLYEWPEGIGREGQLEALDTFLGEMDEANDDEEWLEALI